MNVGHHLEGCFRTEAMAGITLVSVAFYRLSYDRNPDVLPNV
jgi:hypothetical protein